MTESLLLGLIWCILNGFSIATAGSLHRRAHITTNEIKEVTIFLADGLPASSVR